jgi:hypothetical protein
LEGLSAADGAAQTKRRALLASRYGRDEDVNRFRAGRDLSIGERDTNQVCGRGIGGELPLMSDSAAKNDRVLAADCDSEPMDVTDCVSHGRLHHEAAMTDVDQRDGDIMSRDVSPNLLHDFHARTMPPVGNRVPANTGDLFAPPHALVIGHVFADCWRAKL